jgi:hypothetical protein
LFMQGSIMVPETRWALRRAWGFCERHAWGILAVEMCFRSAIGVGPAILYEDLMERCVVAFPASGPFRAYRLARRLRSNGPCLICDMNVYRAGWGAASKRRLDRGRQTNALCQFALDHREHWEDTVCGLCRGNSSEVRCRRHLIEHPGSLSCHSIERHFAMAADVLDRVRVVQRSLMWEHRGIAGPRERAALLSAVGWMNGWRPLLLLVDEATTARVV